MNSSQLYLRPIGSKQSETTEEKVGWSLYSLHPTECNDQPPTQRFFASEKRKEHFT